ncbi:acetyl-CoA carboxylase carboxyltransferase component [Nocardia transvalensis]|uniref:Acetyl-CoA carboxylase carboxyltransferase component n=1 Tax=Nocardia transvalensis TaxID=37333 RepID=A0A7W9P8G8_9NOCA|nr:acyl-CoA carboxylase subunit beta [Nocardia transvalensis]MBB5911360.1 acetyl-CoA carboxylase carboxyltransferase component [Nocardia transvalensis]
MAGTQEKLAELRDILEVAAEPAGEAGIEKRKKKGIPSARERVDILLDRGTFVEMGGLMRQPAKSDAMYGDGVVTGRGTIDGRPVVVIAHDQTVFGGSVGEMFGRKVARALQFAFEKACPVVSINDSGGARIQDAVTSMAWFGHMSRNQERLSGFVPQVSIMLGKCAAGSVYGPVNTDVLVATESSYMFVTGPEVIKAVTGEDVSMEELGGAHSQARNGTVHHVTATEGEAFDWARRYLSFLPSSCRELPPVVNPGLEPDITASDLELNSIIPDSDRAGYDMHDILLRIFDDGDFLEIRAETAANLITGFTRVDGRSVGVVANQPLVLGGAVDARCSDKATHFIRLCNAFGLPLIFVVDTPGVLPGVEEERNGVIVRGGRVFRAIIEATVPIVNLVVRKSYGGAYGFMACKQLGADISLAWPTARIAVIGAESAVDIVGRRQLERVPEDQRNAVRDAMIDQYNTTVATPWIAAERGYIDAVIEPARTRLEIRQALRLLREKEATIPPNPRKHSLYPM